MEENNSDVNHNSTNEYKGNLCDVDESSLLTLQDIILAKQGLPPQKYDAYVLFANEDINFATEIIEKMEDFGLKVKIFYIRWIYFETIHKIYFLNRFVSRNVI